jgi:hypothetical protein
MEPKTIKFLVKLYTILAIVFGGLSVFAVVVPWAKPVLYIALCNLVLTAAMAIMNSILLDRLKGK